DPGETTELSASFPKVVIELTDKYNAWLDEMADPISNQAKRWNPDTDERVERRSREEKKAARKAKNGNSPR
ncbi:MAG: N-acetylgalactosamine 6-sulfatase (GALNS), partial [Planctomycetota bacterium]|nr:N-acetylgalactosamine 6-sulfatase (GALNS) [Planctomycetota bacterium]